MAEGGEAVRVPFGMGAGGAVCVESRKCGSEVGDVGSGSVRCWCCGSGAGARSVSWGLVEAGQREDAGGPRAEAGLGGRRGGCGDGAGGKLT